MSAQGSLRVGISPPCVIASSIPGLHPCLDSVIARRGACRCPVLVTELNIRLGASRARDVLVADPVYVLDLLELSLALDSISFMP